MRILVADDDPINRLLLQRFLAEWNYEVVLASNGAEAGVAVASTLVASTTSPVLPAQTLYRAPASMTANDAFGANPISLAASTLTIINNSLTLPGSTVVNFILGTNSAQVVTPGSLSLNSTLNFAAGDGFGAGTYTLFTYSSSFSGTPTLGSTPAGYPGYTFSITNPPGLVQLLVQAPAPPAPPSFGSISSTANGLVMSGSGGTTNGTFYVLVSTNIALPLSQWTPVATNVFDGSGHFIFTNAIAPNNPQAFYLLQLP